MKNVVMEVKNITKKINEKLLIKDLSFNLYAGEVFGLLGPNGAGKTTAIRMIVGLMKTSHGEVLIKGENLTINYKKAIKHIGAIVETPELYPFMTGYRNLIQYSRMRSNISLSKIDEIVELVGLTNTIHEKVEKYSLGMKQRLGIAQALLHEPSILILDEPMNGLDPAGIREIRSYINFLAKEKGVAILISSHILADMEMICDRIGILKNGEMVYEGTLIDALSQSKEQDVYVELEPIDKAREILINVFKKKHNVKNNFIEFKANREEIPIIIKNFSASDVDIFKLSTKRTTLEDKFLDFIGEDVEE